MFDEISPLGGSEHTSRICPVTALIKGVVKYENIFDLPPAPDLNTPERGSESQAGGASGVASVWHL